MCVCVCVCVCVEGEQLLVKSAGVECAEVCAVRRKEVGCKRVLQKCKCG